MRRWDSHPIDEARRQSNATLLRFDRYNEPPGSRTETPDPITDI